MGSFSQDQKEANSIVIPGILKGVFPPHVYQKIYILKGVFPPHVYQKIYILKGVFPPHVFQKIYILKGVFPHKKIYSNFASSGKNRFIISWSIVNRLIN